MIPLPLLVAAAAALFLLPDDAEKPSGEPQPAPGPKTAPETSGAPTPPPERAGAPVKTLAERRREWGKLGGRPKGSGDKLPRKRTAEAAAKPACPEIPLRADPCVTPPAPAPA